MNISKAKSYFILLLAAIILSGCTGELCIEADDFGHAQFTVSSRYEEDDFLSEQVGASNQIAPWRDSKYRVNGRPLTVTVRNWEYDLNYNSASEVSAWCAWYGASGDAHKLSAFCERLQDCQFRNNNTCSQTRDAQIENAPCLFRKGVGLYALIADKGVDPNLTLSSQQNPKGLSFHVGAPVSGYSIYEVNKRGETEAVGGRVYNYGSDSIKRQYADSKLYFKILDKFYDDNNGQYKITIKSGITQSNPDPISHVTKLVKDFLFGADNEYGLIRNIFLGIVQQPGYQLAVSALLTLYIMFTALSYLSGNLQLTHTELIKRVVKIAIVSALLSSEYSWSFFNDYLFVYFVGGVEQILQIITEAGATGPGSPGILALMAAPQTLSKLLALMFVDWLGLLYIILFIVALYFILMIFFEAAVIYLTALIAIAMIIVMGPIFICFLLFDITKSLFENWLKQLFSYALQPIILFTGLIFISLILRQEIYGSLGFRVCKQAFPKMVNEGEALFTEGTENQLEQELRSSLFYWWFPSPKKGENFSRDLVRIPVPIDHFTTGNDVVGTVSDDGFCEAYGCIEERYVDLPFLDPNSPRDKQRIEQFWNGKFVQLDGMLLILVAIYLLQKFNRLAISTAKFLTGTSGSLTSINNIGDSIRIQTSNKANKKLARVPGKTFRAATDTALGKGKRSRGKLIREELMQKVKEAPSRQIDKWRVEGIWGKGGLEKEALSDRANKAVLSEVQNSTGLKQSDLKKDALENYNQSLIDKLGEINGKVSLNEKINLAQQISNKKPSEINDEFAKAKFGKNFKDLPKAEQEAIKELNDKELRIQARDAENAKLFQKAYVDAYAEMSNRGIGVLGKRSKGLRTLEEIKYDVESQKKDFKASQKRVGQEFYSELELLKRGAFKDAGRHDSRHRHDGSAWHGINTDPEAKNYAKQTYAESLAQEKEEYRHARIKRNIERHNQKHKDNVTSPEFLARAEKEKHPQLRNFRHLQKIEIQSRVKKSFTSGSDPVLKGETYMKNMPESEREHQIKRAQEEQRLIIESMNAKKEIYEIDNQLAKENIDAAKEILSANGYDIEAIKTEELPSALESYYTNAENAERGKQEAEELKASIAEFVASRDILEEIDHSNEIVSEAAKELLSGTNQPSSEAPNLGKRKVRTVEDHKRK